jgi:hypothetical protein
MVERFGMVPRESMKKRTEIRGAKMTANDNMYQLRE